MQLKTGLLHIVEGLIGGVLQKGQYFFFHRGKSRLRGGKIHQFLRQGTKQKMQKPGILFQFITAQGEGQCQTGDRGGHFHPVGGNRLPAKFHIAQYSKWPDPLNGGIGTINPQGIDTSLALQDDLEIVARIAQLVDTLAFFIEKQPKRQVGGTKPLGYRAARKKAGQNTGIAGGFHAITFR